MPAIINFVRHGSFFLSLFDDNATIPDRDFVVLKMGDSGKVLGCLVGETLCFSAQIGNALFIGSMFVSYTVGQFLWVASLKGLFQKGTDFPCVTRGWQIKIKPSLLQERPKVGITGKVYRVITRCKCRVT